MQAVAKLLQYSTATACLNEVLLKLTGLPLQASDADPGCTRLTVKRIDPNELLYFPETVEGLVAQVSKQIFEPIAGYEEQTMSLNTVVA